MAGMKRIAASALWLCPYVAAWLSSSRYNHNFNGRSVRILHTTQLAETSLRVPQGSLHGENACFLPLKQMDQDTFAPRIVQIAGAYPGLTREEFFAVRSEPAPPQGQWTYDFSDPDGPQLGTVAIEGSQVSNDCVDPVAIIAEHPSIGVQLPDAIKDPVDLVVLIDRSKNRYGDRKFLVLQLPGQEELTIAAFNEKNEIPVGSEILGQVDLVQVPWLPSMTPTRTGFAETDEYY